MPEVGSLYYFRTGPYTEFSPAATNRFASIKIIGKTEHDIVVAVLDGVWPHAPSLHEVSTCNVLVMDRFFFRGQPAVIGVAKEWWDPVELIELTYLGSIGLTKIDQDLALPYLNHGVGTSFGTLFIVSEYAEGEWRWKHDRDALTCEVQKEEKRREEKRAAEDALHKNRLKNLTWEKLLADVPFRRWKESPPFPSAKFTAAARKKIRESCRALQKLGGKPKKAEVRNILRETVEWFNTADEEAGFVIETEEREDICEVLFELAYVARNGQLMKEVDEWRNW